MPTTNDTTRNDAPRLCARPEAGGLGRPRRRAGKRAAREDGAALVEFALILPLLAVLLFGMLEFGKLFNYWIDETHLTAEGARWAVVNNVPSGSSLQQYILNQADSGELKRGAHVCISFPNGGTPKVGDPVQVDMAYDAPIPVVSGLLRRFFGNTKITSSIKVKGSSTMRLEAPPTNYSAGNLGGSC